MARIGNRETFDLAYTLTFELGSSEQPEILTARCRVLPVGFADRLLERMPAPLAPRRPLMGEKGVVRENGRPVLHEDDRDESFVAARTRHQRRMGIATILEALDDPSWEFETPEPSDEAKGEVLGAYYDAIYAELVKIRLPQAVILGMVREINRRSGIDESAIAEGAKHF